MPQIHVDCKLHFKMGARAEKKKKVTATSCDFIISNKALSHFCHNGRPLVSAHMESVPGFDLVLIWPGSGPDLLGGKV